MARRTASSRATAALAFAACLASATWARADPSLADQALAQSLFDEARRLVAAGDYAHACPKFAASQHLDPGGGTLLNLALCHDALGLTATAWTEFNEALSRAITDGRPEREARARERIAALRPKLSHLTVSTLAPPPSDLQVSVDGAPWGPAMLGVAVPVDPGPHVVSARAASVPSWSTTVTVGPDADAKSVAIPAPAGPSATPAASMPSTAEPSTPSAPADVERVGGLRTVALVVGGFGVAGLAAGTVFGLLAVNRWNQQKTDCSSTICPSHADAVADHSSLVTDGTISTVAFVAGGALLAGGVLLFLLSPRSDSSTTSVAVSPAVGPRAATLEFRGSF